MAKSEDIFQYLPKSYKSKDEENYIAFLWESYETNYNNGKYPFAYIALPHDVYELYLFPSMAN